MSTLAELSIFPLDKGESVGEYVTRAVRVIADSGLRYELGPLGTCIEGEFAEVMAVIARCHDALAADCQRVYCVIKLDTRRGHENMMEGKIRSVERRMGQA